MRSIRLKLWLSIVGVAALVLALIWISQVVLLENFYLGQKKNQIIIDAKQIVKLIDEDSEDMESITDFDNMQCMEEIIELAESNHYFIQFSDINGNPLYALNTLGNGGVLEGDRNFAVRGNVINNMLQSDEEFFLEENLNSQYGKKSYIVTTMHQTDDISYILMVESELAPVHEAVSTIKTQLIYISVFLILIATVVALLISFNITKPIKKISNAAREVADGNLDVRVKVKSKDEIGKLADDFNIMTKEISKASTLQRELVANVSHDIRTPLTMIKGYAEAIRDLTGDNKEVRDTQLGIIIEESNRLNVLVNDILDLSKLQAGQQQLKFTEFDIAKKLRDIINRYSLLEDTQNYTFKLTAPDSFIIYADEVKIDQVIYNILNNAVNHTGADKLVSVVMEAEDNTAVIKIIDTGKGIEPEHIPLIWDRYYKPYKKGDRKGMGTGLGLSIVKAILTAHNLNFGVDSVVGEGSCFWFEVKGVEK